MPRPRRTHWSALLTSVAIVGLVRPAHAESAITLDWSAPSGCPSGVSVEQDVVRMLGAAPDPAQRLEVTGRVRTTPDGSWSVTLLTSMGGMQGERTLRASDCDEASHAAALVMALMLRPAPTPAPAPTAEPPRRAPEQRRRVAPAAERAPWLVRAALLAGVGSMPGFDAGGSFALGCSAASVAAEIRAAAWLPRTASTASHPSVGGRFWLVEVVPVGCYRHAFGSFRWDSCGGPVFSQMRGSGFGMTDPGKATARWVSLALEQGAAVAMTRNLGLRLSVEALWAPARPAFAIENVGQIHRPDRFGVRGALGVELGW